MDRASAKTTIASEGLERAIWFQRPNGKTDAVAIFEIDGRFRVVSTDERAVEVGARDYKDESEALDMFITLLRDLKQLIASGVVR